MNGPRLFGLSLALCLHGVLLYGLVAHPGPSAFANGSGSDTLTVVAEVSLESADFLTQRAQEASAASRPAQAVPPPASDKQEPKIEPQEKTETEAALPQQTAEPAPQPPETRQGPPPPQAVTQTASVAMKAQDEQHAAAALAARRNELSSRYLVEFSSTLDRYKVHVAETGNVLMRITLAPSGQLLDRAVIQSAGRPELDRAAITTLERAAPFRALPQDLGSSPLTFTILIRFRTR